MRIKLYLFLIAPALLWIKVAGWCLGFGLTVLQEDDDGEE